MKRMYGMGLAGIKIPAHETAILEGTAQIAFTPERIACANATPFDLLRIECRSMKDPSEDDGCIFKSAAKSDPKFAGYPLELAILDPPLLALLRTIAVLPGQDIRFFLRNRTGRAEWAQCTVLGCTTE